MNIDPRYVCLYFLFKKKLIRRKQVPTKLLEFIICIHDIHVCYDQIEAYKKHFFLFSKFLLKRIQFAISIKIFFLGKRQTVFEK